MAYIRHITLVANTAQTVTLDPAANSSRVEIMSRNGLDTIYVSYDGTANPANPTVAGNDFDAVAAAIGAAIRFKRINNSNMVVKLISAAATTVTVRAIA